MLDEDRFREEVERVIRQEEELLGRGVTVAVYTKRKLLFLDNDSPEAALVRSVKISDAVQSLVGRLKVTPAFVVAKGGITSSDVGTKALQVKKLLCWGRYGPAYRCGRPGRKAVSQAFPTSFSQEMWVRRTHLRRRLGY